MDVISFVIENLENYDKSKEKNSYPIDELRYIIATNIIDTLLIERGNMLDSEKIRIELEWKTIH